MIKIQKQSNKLKQQHEEIIARIQLGQHVEFVGDLNGLPTHYVVNGQDWHEFDYPKD